VGDVALELASLDAYRAPDVHRSDPAAVSRRSLRSLLDHRGCRSCASTTGLLVGFTEQSGGITLWEELVRL
jgi:hypothetical protein